MLTAALVITLALVVIVQYIALCRLQARLDAALAMGEYRARAAAEMYAQLCERHAFEIEEAQCVLAGRMMNMPTLYRN